MGHNGHSISKSFIIKKLDSILRERGTWIEASGKLEKILIEKGVPRVKDIEIIKKIFPKSKIEVIGDQYTRNLSSGEFIVESMFGIPEFKGGKY